MNEGIDEGLDLLEKLEKRFTGGRFDFVKFAFKETEIELQLPRIKVKGNRKYNRLIMSFIFEYAKAHSKDWIMICAEDEEVFYRTTSPEADKVLSILLEIDGLTPNLVFEKESVFNRNFKLSFQNEVAVNIKTHQEVFTTIKNKEDAKNFNKLQKELRKEHEVVKKAMLEIAQQYDEKATFSDDDKLIQFCGQNFAFVTRKLEKGWKVSYFKKFNSDYIFEVPSLMGFKNELIEMTDKFAREERFLELFK